MVWKQLQTNPAALNALLGGSVAALATALGALPVLLTHHPSAHRTRCLALAQA
jgi:ZIP family zinc transporter